MRHMTQWFQKRAWIWTSVLGACLLVLATGYMLARFQHDRAITQELTRATQRLEQLARRDPYPNSDNIHAAKAEATRLKNFFREVKDRFLPVPHPPIPDSLAFRTYLDSTRAELVQNASDAGVELPANYWFTFEAQKGLMTFAPGSLPALAAQLAEIKTVCDVVFDAKVNSLVWLRRVPVEAHDILGSQDYLTSKSQTNQGIISTPYELTFEGVTSQLAAVLDGFARLPECFVVSKLQVEPAHRSSEPNSLRGPASQNRYWGRELPPFSIPHLPRAWSSSSAIVILDQQLLRFTLGLQAIKAQNL